MPISPFPLTPAGWVYMADNQPIIDTPEYTRRLAAALAGFTPGPAVDPGDTGWITTDLGIVAAAGWTISSYAVRRLASRVIGRVSAVKTAAITSAADGNFTDAVAFTMPAGWTNGCPAQVDVRVFQPGTRQWFGRIDGLSGQVVFSHGLPNQTLAAGTTLDFNLDYLTT
jgi:hypothetical protein